MSGLCLIIPPQSLIFSALFDLDLLLIILTFWITREIIREERSHRHCCKRQLWTNGSREHDSERKLRVSESWVVQKAVDLRQIEISLLNITYSAWNDNKYWGNLVLRTSVAMATFPVGAASCFTECNDETFRCVADIARENNIIQSTAMNVLKVIILSKFFSEQCLVFLFFWARCLYFSEKAGNGFWRSLLMKTLLNRRELQ